MKFFICLGLTVAICLNISHYAQAQSGNDGGVKSWFSGILKSAGDAMQRRSEATKVLFESRTDEQFIDKAFRSAISNPEEPVAWNNPASDNSGEITVLSTSTDDDGNDCYSYERKSRNKLYEVFFAGNSCDKLGDLLLLDERTLAQRKLDQDDLKPKVTEKQPEAAVTAETVVPSVEPVRKAYVPRVAQPVALVRETQALLTQIGFNPGPADGMYGGKTRRAIEAYQSSRGFTVDGRVSPLLASQMRSEVAQIAATPSWGRVSQQQPDPAISATQPFIAKPGSAGGVSSPSLSRITNSLPVTTAPQQQTAVVPLPPPSQQQVVPYVAQPKAQPMASNVLAGLGSTSLTGIANSLPGTNLPTVDSPPPTAIPPRPAAPVSNRWMPQRTVPSVAQPVRQQPASATMSNGGSASLAGIANSLLGAAPPLPMSSPPPSIQPKPAASMVAHVPRAVQSGSASRGQTRADSPVGGILYQKPVAATPVRSPQGQQVILREAQHAPQQTDVTDAPNGRATSMASIAKNLAEIAPAAQSSSAPALSPLQQAAGGQVLQKLQPVNPVVTQHAQKQSALTKGGLPSAAGSHMHPSGTAPEANATSALTSEPQQPSAPTQVALAPTSPAAISKSTQAATSASLPKGWAPLGPVDNMDCKGIEVVGYREQVVSSDGQTIYFISVRNTGGAPKAVAVEHVGARNKMGLASAGTNNVRIGAGQTQHVQVDFGLARPSQITVQGCW
ncbi:MAG: hypothetical protein HN394_02990 [Rhodospirillaceae bacterium]|jgi:peptidoglycan hydrolase-like protein with peptidoglycan-binding domain|nr:hypothetical protein [Rhodospirillaceae bacterium]